MRHISRKTIVNANQCRVCITQHRQQYRGIGLQRLKGLCHYFTFAVAIFIAVITFSSTSAIATETAIKEASNRLSQHRVQVANSKHYQLKIPEQTLASALTNLSEQTDIQVLFPFDIAQQHRIKPLEGSYNLQQALEILLQNTGLYGGLTPSGVITVLSDDLNQNSKGKRRMKTQTTKRKTLLATMIGLFAVGGMSGASAQDQAEGATQQMQIDEIIVTANKRGAGQSIQDTAMAISALSGDTIEKRGLVGMDDYLRTLPGISIQDRGAGQNSIVIRGLSADPQASSSTAGVYLGEVPLTGLGTSSATGESGNADIKLVNVERIEVLRGPQGTLYGADSMGRVVSL